MKKRNRMIFCSLNLMISSFLLMTFFGFVSAKPLQIVSSVKADYFNYPPEANATPTHGSIAVGPCNVLVSAINGTYSFTKEGKKDFIVETSNSSLFAGAAGADVQVLTSQFRFDEFSQRWFGVAISPGLNTRTATIFYIIVSDGPEITPCSTWQRFSFRQDEIAPVGNIGAYSFENFDFENFGIDKNALYIGINLYTGLVGQPVYNSSAVFVFEKQSLLAGNPIATAFRNLGSATSGIYAPVPADNFDDNPEFGYVIGIDRVDPTILHLFRIAHANTANPQLLPDMILPIEPIADPIRAPFKNLYGNRITLFTVDRRLFASHIRHNTLYTVQHIGVNAEGVSNSPDRTGVRWYQIDLLNLPNLRFSTLFDTGPLSNDTRFFTYPAIMTTCDDTVVMSGTISSQNTSLNAFATHIKKSQFQSDSTLINNLQLLTNSTANTNTFAVFINILGAGIGVEPWGLYTSSAPDGKSVWTAQPYSDPDSDQWALQAVELRKE